MAERDDWMQIGRIAGPFGVRGEVKVNLDTDYPERFAQLAQIYVGPDHRAMDVDRVRFHKGQALLTLAGVTSPEQVEPLRELVISVPRSEAVELPEGHYFLDDLIGIAVSTTDGRELGAITDVLRTGSNDVYVVGTGRDACLVPAIQDAVMELDLQGRRLVVEPWILE